MVSKVKTKVGKDKIRVLVAKPGTDGHRNGAELITMALRDAGMEAIYTGCYQTPEMIARAALAEDVDVVGLSLLNGSHMDWFPEVAAALRAKGVDAIVIGGGAIPPEDRPLLEKKGILGNFGAGTPTQEIVDFIVLKVAEKKSGKKKAS